MNSGAILNFLHFALEEAWKVKNSTLPNPAVGAVLISQKTEQYIEKILLKPKLNPDSPAFLNSLDPVKALAHIKEGMQKGEMEIYTGATQPAGQDHAEVVALKRAGSMAHGGILFVTLEPCSHYGRTPPCTNAIISAGIKKVYIGVLDPNPKVAGKGCQKIREAGIEVYVLEDLKSEKIQSHENLLLQLKAFYSGYFQYATTQKTQIVLKVAQSLDGSMNAAVGQETAITGQHAKNWVHSLRSMVDAVMIGGNTLRTDNPDLRPWLIRPEYLPHVLVLTQHSKEYFHSLGNFKLFDHHRSSKTHFLLNENSSENVPEILAQETNQTDREMYFPYFELFTEKITNPAESLESDPLANSQLRNEHVPVQKSPLNEDLLVVQSIWESIHKRILHSSRPISQNSEPTTSPNQVSSPSQFRTQSILRDISQKGYHSVLLEAGPQMAKLWLESNCWDVFYLLVSPKTLPSGQKWTEGLSPHWIQKVYLNRYRRLGEDWLLEILPKPLKSTKPFLESVNHA